ncbi:MAG: endonuclease V [Candidatus Diapherotrites archaeon]|nr:endonuclease V [Candidatus Diapherotrites archaeon]
MNEPLEVEVRRVLAVDVAYRGCEGVGVAALFDEDGELLEWRSWRGKVHFPYVPTYLAFREAPFMAKAAGGLVDEETLLLVDGHGTSHPRGAGEAVHVGAILGVPSLGVAKSPLTRGQESFRGAYISPGWGLPDPRIVERFWFDGKKQPLPLEVADRLSKRMRREIP